MERVKNKGGDECFIAPLVVQQIFVPDVLAATPHL